MSKYDPESKDQEIINLNAAWDDVQAEVITKFILTSVVEWVRFRLGLLSHLQGREFESPFWLSKVNVYNECENDPKETEGWRLVHFS